MRSEVTRFHLDGIRVALEEPSGMVVVDTGNRILLLNRENGNSILLRHSELQASTNLLNELTTPWPANPVKER